METSDESFAWTDASSDSSKNNNMLVEMKQNKSKKYSDKGEAHKNESHNEAETVQVDKKHKLKKRKKHEVHEEIENDNTYDLISRPMKSESNSDLNEHKSRKRHTCDETSISSNCEESLHEAEDYLNFRVKQEKVTFEESTPMKKKKKKDCKGKTNEDREMELPMPSNDKIDFEKHNLYDLRLVNGEHEIDTSFKKKKKKKKKKSVDNDMSEILEDSEDYHKTKKKKKKYKELSQNDASDDNFQHVVDNNSQIISSALAKHSNKDNVKEECNDDKQSVSTIENSTTSVSQKSGKIEGTSKKACRISDRIRFEEDSLDYELNKVSRKANSNVSIQLEQFINSNISLKPLEANLHSDAEISDDDEVWILKGPHDISITDFKNAKLSLDTKKKVKINGNTYDTFIDTTICAAPILISNKKQLFLKNMPLKGVINLRKRIPKVHIPYESLMMSNESSFIQLPETKCRHPLFGIHYKNAVKVPTEIAERLNSWTVSDTDGKKKKIYKEKHEIESEIEVNPNIEELHSNKKKRKLEHKLENRSDIETKPKFEQLHSSNNKRKTKENLEIESDIELKPNIEELHSKSKKRKVEIESDIEVKANYEELHFNKKKRKMKDKLEIESDSEVKPSIEELHSKKKKEKRKERLETESDNEVKLNFEISHSNKKKRKHSDEKAATKKAKRAEREPSGAEAWESEQAIEQNLFDF